MTKRKKSPEDDPNSIQRQVEGGRRFAQREGMEILGEFTEVISGRKFTFENRAEWQRMLLFLKTTKVDAVLMKDPTRFGRKVHYALDAEAELAGQGVLLRFYEQPTMRPEDPKDRLQFIILLAFAEYEAEVTRERTVDALEWLQRSGVHLGHVPKHFERGENGELVPTDIARQVAEFRHANWSYDRIAETLGIPKGDVWNVCRFLAVEKARREALAVAA